MEKKYILGFKIDLSKKTNEEKYKILQWLKPLATNYTRGHYSIKMIDEDYNLRGANALNGFKCFSVCDNNRFEAHLNDFSFTLLPFKSLNVDSIL